MQPLQSIQQQLGSLQPSPNMQRIQTSTNNQMIQRAQNLQGAVTLQRIPAISANQSINNQIQQQQQQQQPQQQHVQVKQERVEEQDPLAIGKS
jgi:hypothetical protein